MWCWTSPPRHLSDRAGTWFQQQLVGKGHACLPNLSGWATLNHAAGLSPPCCIGWQLEHQYPQRLGCHCHAHTGTHLEATCLAIIAGPMGKCAPDPPSPLASMRRWKGPIPPLFCVIPWWGGEGAWLLAAGSNRCWPGEPIAVMGLVIVGSTTALVAALIFRRWPQIDYQAGAFSFLVEQLLGLLLPRRRSELSDSPGACADLSAADGL